MKGLEISAFFSGTFFYFLERKKAFSLVISFINSMKSRTNDPRLLGNLEKGYLGILQNFPMRLFSIRFFIFSSFQCSVLKVNLTFQTLDFTCTRRFFSKTSLKKTKIG